MPKEVDCSPPAPEHNDHSGPDTVDQAWNHSVNLVDLYNDTRESAHSWLPLGLGFAIEHPSVLASPEFEEMLVLDPVMRTARAVGDLGGAAIESWQDLGKAEKGAVGMTKDATCFGIDLISLNWGDLGQDIKDFGDDTYQVLKGAVNSSIVDPAKGIIKAGFEFL